MPTLKELMGDLTRGDGRRFFNLERRIVFEPIFLDCYGDWLGLSPQGIQYSFCEVASNQWQIDNPATYRKKIKIRMYSPIYRNNSGIGYFMEDGWSSSKNDFDQIPINPIVGWQEMEVEVDE